MSSDDGERDEAKKIHKSDEAWRAELSAAQFQVLRGCGTERAFSGPYWDDHEPGTYLCAGCGQDLFSSTEKFDSGSGWPSFTAPAAAAQVEAIEDRTHGMHRTEVRCGRCGGHLGHVFDDGPPPTGRRYCINGTALKKVPPK